MANLTARAIIQGVDKASPVFRRVGAAAGAMGRRLHGMSGAMGRAAGAQRRMATGLNGTNGLGAGFAAAGFLANENAFQSAMNQTRAILNVTDKKAFKPHEDMVVGLASKYPATSAAIAQGAAEMAMAGMSLEQVNSVLEASVQGSMASGESIKTVGQGVTDVVMGLGRAMDKKNFLELNNVMAAAATSYAQDYSQFLSGFRKTAPLARVAGLEINHLSALLGTLANAGFKAEKGGTALRTMIINLGAPTPAARKQFAKFLSKSGKSLEDFRGQMDKTAVSGKTGMKSLQAMLAEVGLSASANDAGLQKILNNDELLGKPAALRAALVSHLKKGLTASDSTEDLQTAVNSFVAGAYKNLDVMGLFRALGKAGAMNDIEALKEIFGKRFSAQGAAIMASMFQVDPKTGLAEFDRAMGVFEKRIPNAVKRFAGILMSGLPGAIKRLGGAFDALLRTMASSGAMDTVVNALNGLRDGINWMADANPKLLKFATLALMAVGALAPLGFILTGVEAAAAAILSPVGLAIAALIGGAVLIIKYWDEVKRFFTGFFTGVRAELDAAGLGPAIDGIAFVLEGLVWLAKAFLDQISQWFTFTEKGNKLTDFFESGQQAGRTLVGILRDILNPLRAIRRLAGAAINWWGGSKPAPVPAPKVDGKRARGGPVSGGSTYLVGEKGPELFTPGRSGGITPNHKLGARGGISIGAPQVHVTVNAQGGNASEIIAAVKQDLKSEIRDAFRGAISDTGYA